MINIIIKYKVFVFFKSNVIKWHCIVNMHLVGSDEQKMNATRSVLRRQ